MSARTKARVEWMAYHAMLWGAFFLAAVALSGMGALGAMLWLVPYPGQYGG